MKEAKTVYKIKTEIGETATVEMHIIKKENSQKPFGIYARIVGGEEVEEAYAEERFYTYEEAVATINMLCKGEVTPCTLCDII